MEHFIFKTLISDLNKETYNVYTSIKVDGTIYRANPSYRGPHGMTGHNTISAYLPGYYHVKLLAFIKTGNTIKVVIHSTESKKESIHDSCLTE